MRRPAEFFDDQDVVLVHIASTLRGALKLEQLLGDEGVDYAVETDQYRSGFLFFTTKTGAFFYVGAVDADRTRDLMRRNRVRIHRD